MKSTKKEESWKEFAREDKVQSGFYKYALGSYTYSLADAIADIIDNSITYGSKTVIVKYGFPKNKRPYIAIINDGDGMDETEIGLAMKIGLTKSRKGNDLGFFGTGLKAASLSQCKRFTVYSNKNGRTSLRVWDSNLIDTSGKLLIRFKKHTETPDELLFDKEIKRGGTVILWEILNDEYSENQIEFYKRMSNLSNYLGLIFHKFLESKKLKISINEEDSIAPVNPFDYGNKSMTIDTLTTLNKSKTTVQCHLIPLEEEIIKDKPIQLAQGLYVYRKERLVVKGEWINSGFKNKNIYNQLRIEVNINEDPENIWKISVSKNSLEIPVRHAEELRRIISFASEKVGQVYLKRSIKRSTPIKNKEKLNIKGIWEFGNNESGKKIAKISRKHPLIEELLKNLEKGIEKEFISQETVSLIKYIFDFIESDLPLSDINGYLIKNEMANIKLPQIGKIEDAFRLFLKNNGYNEIKINLLIKKIIENEKK